MIEYAVVGSGIGGSSMAAYLDAKGYETVLFEKEPYLGGCSSTFVHGGYAYNTGATTLAGYQEGHIVKSMFDKIGFTPELLVTDPTIVIIQNEKITPRFSDLEDFLEVLEKNYPHPKNREFWTLVHRLGKEFYALHGHYYSNRSLWHKLISLTSFFPLLVRFQRFLRTNAYDFINDFYGDISEEYQKFLEAQILIVAQAHSKEINFFTAALSLGYSFNETHYVPGGFGRLFDQMTAKMKYIKRNTQIEKIERHSDHFTLHTKNESLKAKKVILNSTIYDSEKLFNDEKVKNYYQKYETLNNHQSSFMLYMTIRSDKKYEHHYQLIQDEQYTHSISNAVFVSFSDVTDNMLTPEGHYSVTASIHTDVRFWEDKQTYQSKKSELQTQMLKSICAILDINEEEIVHQFAATPRSFKRYINRSQLGGNAITMKNFLPKLPSNDTPIKDLYQVGDTVYAAQGWPGVMLGVENLRGLLDV
ncbi:MULTISPECIES: NAD(P)/FAD-dependent oxidoreductase [Sulfurovum]|uniref:NAD(P)/FAD-dependent oxidoreductase n=1 Tax=Sulfurovum xiamenensis TaxID=3019066 RepID=A0ABT7QR58_9BACT|nr:MULTISPECIES: NAD(P)/FAD-dependent oxidoreductase [Sulfurovum]EIF51591.1 phytoene dehydrogenase [Sulfurovum sp. AR]MDM5263559.1 NAD(P)/FAD-dependent oxidoreductase [Sulfurovum xiamenensis]